MANKFKKIKPLIIGMGVAGKRHLEAQLDLGIKTGVFTTNPRTAQLLKKQKNVIVFNNLADGIDWSSLIHVCTPDDKHTKFVSQALKKGKAVLCEKSFTTNLKDALFLQDLVHKYNCLLFVGQNYRLTPSFLETKKWVKEGKIGPVTKIETTYLHDVKEYQKRKALRKNQDFLYIAGSHAVDLAFWIINEKIVGIEATSKNELSYNINLKFSSGLLGNIKLDATSPQSISGTDLIVYGEGGKLMSHYKKDELLYFKEGEKGPESFTFPNTKTFTIAKEIKIINDFLSEKTSSTWPIPEVDEAVSVIEVLDKVQKSIS